jgi:ribosomal-protein-alanine N-acetyltransferase
LLHRVFQTLGEMASIENYSDMGHPRDIESDRLKLVALTAELAELQVSEPVVFFDRLGVEMEPSWPPDLMGADTMCWVRDQLAAQPENAGWYFWVYISPGINRLVGVGGFKGAPTKSGDVEIGYSMLASYREQGLATEAVNALIEWAYKHAEVKRVVAHTRSDRNPSHRVLEKAGFVEGRHSVDEDEQIEVIAWAHDRQFAAE